MPACVGGYDVPCELHDAFGLPVSQFGGGGGGTGVLTRVVVWDLPFDSTTRVHDLPAFHFTADEGLNLWLQVLVAFPRIPPFPEDGVP